MRLSPPPAQAATTPRERSRLHDGLIPGLLAGDAKLLVECTFHEARLPLWVEGIGIPPDFSRTPDFGVARIHKAQPYRVAAQGHRPSRPDHHSRLASFCFGS